MVVEEVTAKAQTDIPIGLINDLGKPAMKKNQIVKPRFGKKVNKVGRVIKVADGATVPDNAHPIPWGISQIARSNMEKKLRFTFEKVEKEEVVFFDATQSDVRRKSSIIYI